MASETFLATFGLIGLRLVELHGIDAKSFARQINIPSIEIADPNARVSIRVVDTAFERAAQLISDPAFALRAAECWHPSLLGVLGFAWLSSESLGAALGRLERYSKIVGQKASCRCEESTGNWRFVFDHGRGDAPIGPVMADFALSIIVSMCRANFGPAFALEQVTLRRPRPADAGPYTRYFACPVTFDAGEDSFVLAQAVVQQQLPTSNRELAQTLDGILAAQLAALQRQDLETQCRAYLLNELVSGEPSEERLAKSLAMSRRSLQRKLAEVGLTFRGILEKTRYDLALYYLDDPSKSVTDITFLLGFSEQSAFTRAFKRWSGKAPSIYRFDLAKA